MDSVKGRMNETAASILRGASKSGALAVCDEAFARSKVLISEMG
jgi:hypothetical protein